MTSDKLLLTIKETSKILGVTPLTLRNWDKQGKLKAMRHPMNNYRVYKRTDIDKLMQGIENGSAEQKFTPRKKIGSKRNLEVKHML